MTNYYTYDQAAKTLAPADRVITIGRTAVANPTAEQYASIGAYPLAATQPTPAPLEGKVAVPDGYELVNGEWSRTYVYEDAPLPTLAEYDAAMEEHLRREREERGYTTREPDSYLTSAVPRWSQDAMDWVAHRDDVMGYALALIKGVQAGEREPPTMAEFRAGLPRIEWTYTEGA